MAAVEAGGRDRAGGVAEVMVDGETGFLVPPRDHAAMAARIVAAQGRRPAIVDGRGGAGARARPFTVERMVEETAAVYARLAGTPRAADTASLAARG